MSSSVNYLIAAYAILVGFLGGYHLYMRAKIKGLEAERDKLARQLAEAGRAGD